MRFSSDFFAPLLKVTICFWVVLTLHAEEQVVCDCSFHAAEEKEKAETFSASLSLPNDLPKSFSVQVPYFEEVLTVHLKKNKVFGENTKFLVASEDGSLAEIAPGPECTYLGWVEERPEYIVSAVLSDDGLRATIFPPEASPIEVKPSGGSRESGLHLIMSDSIKELPVGQLSISPQVAKAGSSSLGSSTATLPPERVMDVLEYEIGVEIGSRAFLSDTYSSNLATAQASAQSTVTNLDARYLRAAGIKHRLGTVIIRTDAATDPLRDSVTATGGATGADSSLAAFRDYWNGNPQEVGNTHDLAVYHVRSAPSGLGEWSD